MKIISTQIVDGVRQIHDVDMNRDAMAWRTKRINAYGFLLFREQPGVISKGPCWVLSDSRGYLYLHDRLLGLVRQVVTEWRHERHIVG